MNIGRADVDQFLKILDKSLAACAAAAAGSAK
jgi:hypothetical protein